jgi:uncharacterized protein
MIIDSHHHMVPLKMNEGQIAGQAEHLFNNFGGGARSSRIERSVEDIKRAILSYGPDPNGEKLLQRMDQTGIDVTVLCETDNINLGLSNEEILSNNRICANIAAGSHGKIIALAGIDPRRKEATKLFRVCIEDYGMRGLKWHCDAGFPPNGEEAYAVLGVAEQLGVPLLTHCGPAPAPSRKPKIEGWDKLTHPSFLDDVTADFPGLKVIAAHMGMLAWLDEWAGLAHFRRNLYGDLAFWQMYAASNYEWFCHALRYVLDIAGTDSVLFGSDALIATALMPNEDFIGIIRDLPQKAPPGVRFTREEVEGILGGNARNVFSI